MTVTRGIELANSTLFSDANLISYYKLENTADSKGTYTLTNNGTTPFSTAVFNNGMDQGTSNTGKFLSVNHDLGVTTGSFSFCFWVKINQVPTSGTNNALIEHGDSGADVRHWITYTQAAGTNILQWNRQRENIANEQFTYYYNLPTNSFTHLAYSYNGTTLYGYLNGTQVGSVAAAGTGASGVDIDYTYIGAGRSQNSPAPYRFSNSLMDDVAFFNRFLTSAEVNTLLTYRLSNSDNVGISDSLYKDSAYIRSNSDTLNITDTLVRTSDVFLTIEDTLIVITDTVLTTKVNIVTITQDTMGITDENNRLVSYIRNKEDTFNILDTIDRTQVNYSQLTDDIVVITDSLLASIILYFSLSDSIGITDFVSTTFLINTVLSPIIEFYQIDTIVPEIGSIDEITPSIYNIIDG